MSDTRPKLKRLTQTLIFIDAAIWLAFALITRLGLHPAIPEGDLYRWGMAGMAFIAGIMLILLYYLSARSRIAYFSLLGGLGMIAFLSITDDFGIYDLAMLALNLLAFVLLVVDRKRYLDRDSIKGLKA